MQFCIPFQNPAHASYDSLLSIRIRNSSLQRLGVCAHNFTNLLRILEDQECRHGVNTKLLRNVGDFIDIDLDEVNVRELVREPI